MIRINLLPVKISRRQEAVRSELLVVGLVAGVLAAGLAAAFVSVQSRVNTVRAENNGLQEEIRRVEEIAKDVKKAEELKAELQRKLGVIKQLKASKSGPVHLMDELSLATPEKLQLQQLDERSRRLEFAGVAVSNEVISQFLTNLEQSEYFDDVFLNAIDQVDTEGVKLKNFSISARLVVPGTEAEPSAPSGR
ncbi:MAG: PilN domain-containing protein [Myxococcota bacterium]|nr:PilN domain-containing protein [Myxococcota bacterium]